MHVFMTGASGYVGSAVAEELLAHGHSISGLARSEASAQKLEDAGVRPHRGNLEDLASVKAGAARADAVIHLGFDHDFSRFEQNCAHDADVVHAIGEQLSGSDRLFLVTSGTALLESGRISTEDMLAPTGPYGNPRTATERAGAEVARRGVKLSAVRLAPSVHGDGDHGMIRLVADLARKNGESVYAAQGQNRWCAVHRLDAARLYRLALEKGEGGVHYHAVAEEEIPFKTIAEALGKSLGLPVVGKSGDADVQRHFEWLAFLATADMPSSSAWTRAFLGWVPREVSLNTDIERGVYRL